MQLEALGSLRDNPEPLRLAHLADPTPGPGEILVRVSACGVCHTELDEIEGRTAPPRLPVVPGHEVIGRVDKCGAGARRFRTGERVGVGWIHSSSVTPDENIDRITDLAIADCVGQQPGLGGQILAVVVADHHISLAKPSFFGRCVGAVLAHVFDAKGHRTFRDSQFVS